MDDDDSTIVSKRVLLTHVVRATTSFDGEGAAADISAVFDMIRENARLLATTLQFVKNRIKSKDEVVMVISLGLIDRLMDAFSPESVTIVASAILPRICKLADPNKAWPSTVCFKAQILIQEWSQKYQNQFEQFRVAEEWLHIMLGESTSRAISVANAQDAISQHGPGAFSQTLSGGRNATVPSSPSRTDTSRGGPRTATSSRSLEKTLRESNDVSPAPTMEDASPSRNSSHAAESWQRTSSGGQERGARGRTAARSCDRGGINESSVHFGDEGKLGGSFDGQVEAARHGLVASSAELTSKRHATFDTGGGAGPLSEAAEHHEGAKAAPSRTNESFDSSTVECALDEASSPSPQQECLSQAQVAQVAANARDAVQLLVSHLQRLESGRVGHGGAHKDSASLKSIPAADVRECRRFHVLCVKLVVSLSIEGQEDLLAELLTIVDNLTNSLRMYDEIVENVRASGWTVPDREAEGAG